MHKFLSVYGRSHNDHLVNFFKDHLIANNESFSRPFGPELFFDIKNQIHLVRLYWARNLWNNLNTTLEIFYLVQGSNV